MKFLVRLLISSLIIIGCSFILPGIHIETFWTAIVVAIVLGILNTVVRPILVLLTIPVTIFTLGLFLIGINIIIIELADFLVSGFTVDSFLWALAFSLLTGVANWIINRK